MTASDLNLALRLVFAYQHQPHLLDDAERFRKVPGRGAAANAEILGMVRGVIKGLHNGNADRQVRLSEALKEARQNELNG
jgi:hypothetical protein